MLPSYWPITHTLTEEEMRKLVVDARRYIRDTAVALDDDLFTPCALMDGCNACWDTEVGRSFHGHGISKGSAIEQLRALDGLLTSGPDPGRPFHTVPLGVPGASALGAAAPYSDGAFVVLGAPHKGIRESGIQVVLVNDHFYHAIPLLRERFPHIQFIHADQARPVLEALLQGKTITTTARAEEPRGTKISLTHKEISAMADRMREICGDGPRIS